MSPFDSQEIHMYIHVYCKHVHIVEVTQFSASTSACSAQHYGVSVCE